MIEITAFGSNPGRLRMFVFIPPGLASGAPLVTVLHGCGQTAAGYLRGSGWASLARTRGFAVLAPQQRRANNARACFNWFAPDDVTRDSGEALSIRQMIGHIIERHGIDASRLFVTGLSAGGAMTAAMLADYPELFAGGAILAGVPFGAASNVGQALAAMMGRVRHSPGEWGALVRAAAPAPPAWPRLSIWQGGADRTVSPVNAEELLKQWANVQNLDLDAGAQASGPGWSRRTWRAPHGQPRLETWVLPGMGHGAPIDAARLGQAEPFFLDVGLSSTEAIADFWGLAAPTARASGGPTPGRGLLARLAGALAAIRRRRPKA